MQDAAAAALAFHEKLEAARTNQTLTKNQLKKQRKKRAKLFQQAALSDLVDGCQPSKRIRLDTPPEASTSSQLGPGSCQQGHACSDDLPSGQQLQSFACPAGSIQSGTHNPIAMPGDDGAEDSYHRQQQQQQQQRKRQKQEPLLLARPLKPLKPRTLPQPDRRVGGPGQASQLSQMFVALQHQARCEQQQQQQQEQQEQPQTSVQLAPAAAAAAAADMELEAVQATPADASLTNPAAADAAGPDESTLPCASSSSSRGPCRADLSGHLMVIKQQLSDNCSNDHSSSSTLMHVPLLAGGSSTMDRSSQGQLGQQQQQQWQQQMSRKRQQPSCLYGNYHHYYGYRIGPSGFEDPRLKVLDPSWLKGADVLDVGCNEGLLTLALAVGGGCRSVVGVDIDPVLVSKACTNLSRSRAQLTQQLRAAVAARDAALSDGRMAPPAPQQPLEKQQQQQEEEEEQQQQQQQQQQPLPSSSTAAAEGPGSGVVASSAALASSSKSSKTAVVGDSSSNDNSDTAVAAAGDEAAPPQAPEQQEEQQQAPSSPTAAAAAAGGAAAAAEGPARGASGAALANGSSSIKEAAMGDSCSNGGSGTLAAAVAELVPSQPQEQQQAAPSSPAATPATAEGPAGIVVASSAALASSSKSSKAAAVGDGSGCGGSDTPVAAAGDEAACQAQQQQRDANARIQQLTKQIKSLTRVSFKAGNWLDMGCPANKYEVMTCFSVTKWIHLNWGDDGIMKLFHKFYRCLAPGGLLVLEPQPFKSYHNAVNKQGVQAAPFRKFEQLKLRPDGFCAFLTQRVGFELVQQLNAVSQVAGAEAVPVKGFDRPILVLRKPAKK